MSEILFWQKIIRQGQRVAGLVQRPMTLGVRAIALDEAGRVFLVRHTYVPGFHLPGGAVERGETAIDSCFGSSRKRAASSPTRRRG